MGEAKAKKTARGIKGAPTPEWVTLLVAATIGPQIALYEMSDPEGESRVVDIHRIMNERIVGLWDHVNQRNDFSYDAFAIAAQDVIVRTYSDFIVLRMSYLAEHGMPSKPLIVLPH